MKAFIFCGEQGRGKTTGAFEIISHFPNKDLYAYDIHKAYTHFPNNKIKGLPTMDAFFQITKTVKNSVIVFEEATIFFGNHGRVAELIELLVLNHHSQNVIIFLFHSVRSVPVEIMDFVQFMHIYHTNDRVTLLKNKFRDDPDLLEILSDVYEKTLGTEKNRVTGEYADERSKEFYHYNRVYSR